MLRKLYAGVGSVKLTVVLLLLLSLLTYLGTLSQIDRGLYASQKLYFDSWLVLHPVRELRIPLPGGQMVMALLLVNLLIGGFVRMRRTWRVAGIYIVHAGIALLLLAGFVKLRYSDDGYMALYEGDSANFFESHHHWELAIAGPPPRGVELVVSEQALRSARGQRLLLQAPEMPFEVVVDAYAQNSKAVPAGDNVDGADVVDGYTLFAEPPAVETENDMPGLYATIRRKGGGEERMLLVGSTMLMPRARSLTVDGETWTLDLRKQRFALPFTVRLDDFRKEDHPGLAMAKSYESDITQRVDRDERRVRIEMNAPLRDRGYVLFQSGYGPQSMGAHRRYWSVFSVVRNPSDHWPLYSCLIIWLGLTVHFGQGLWRYVRREARAA